MSPGLCRVSLLALACALACGGSDGDGPRAPAEPVPEEQPRSPSSEANIEADVVSPELQPAVALPPGSSSPEPIAEEPITEEPIAAPARRCDDSLSFDELYAAINLDLRSQDEQDALFYRYVSLSHRLNQGICPEDLGDDRMALFMAVNSLSTETTIALPEAIDEDGVVYRIDLRDFGWDRAVTVAGESFSNKWDAIVAASPYAVELEGDDADSAKLAAATSVPVLFSDAVIDVSVVGELYYALAEIPADIFTLFAQLGIDLANLDGNIIRAGMSRSRMSQQDTIIQRLDQGRFQGFYWSRFDVSDTAAGQSIFSNPLGFQGEVSATLFTQPNGLLAYALFDAVGSRVADTAVLVDQSEPDGRMRNTVSCSACHFAGVNSVVDEVGPFVQSNSRQFDADTFAEVEESFLPQAELDAAIRLDNDAYQATLARAGLGSATVDPVSSVVRRFAAEVTLAVAAGELGVTPDVLGAELIGLSNEADPVLATLAQTSLGRAQFDDAYLPALCSLLISSENRPRADACDTALE